jgi:hypothetical protein
MVPSNNPLQRSGHDKVHAPGCCAVVGFSGSAPQVRRAAADAGRYVPSQPSLSPRWRTKGR